MTEQKNFFTKISWIFLGAVIVYCIGRFTFTLPDDVPYSHTLAKYGINAFLIWGGFLLLFYMALRPRISKRALIWVIPLGLIALSMALYDNTFTTAISIIILPIAYFIFTTHQAHSTKRQHAWSVFAPIIAILSLVQAAISMFKIPRALSGDLRNIQIRTSRNTAFQVFIGMIVLFFVSGLIVIPLLSSVEPRFAEIFKDIIAFFENFYLPDAIVKFFTAGLYGFFFVGLAHYWRVYNRNFTTKSYDPRHQHRSIIINIVLFGIIVLYGLFLAIQIQNLFVGRLPIDFSQTERLVKSGFWQLFLLTALNTTLFGMFYGRISALTKKFLGAFVFVSLLLVLSAVNRIWLYVTNYGLSHEKFFALYTAFFCALLFIGFIILIIRKKPIRLPVLYIIAIVSLWGYALAVILPIDRIIVGTNLTLTQRADSRVNINELPAVIGAGALPFVEKNLSVILAEGQKDITTAARIHKETLLDGESGGSLYKTGSAGYKESEWVRLRNSYAQDHWLPWIEDQRTFLAQKRGLQHSVGSLRYTEQVDLTHFEKHEREFYDPLSGIYFVHDQSVTVYRNDHASFTKLSAEQFKYALSHEEEKSVDSCRVGVRHNFFDDKCVVEQRVEIEFTNFETDQNKKEALVAAQSSGSKEGQLLFDQKAAALYEKIVAQKSVNFSVPLRVNFSGVAYPLYKRHEAREVLEGSFTNNIVVINDHQILYIESETKMNQLQSTDYEWDRALEKSIVQADLVQAIQSMKFIDAQDADQQTP